MNILKIGRHFLCLVFVLITFVSGGFFCAADVEGNKVYIDNESKLSFDIPEGWSEQSFTEEREFIDAKFCANDDYTKMIIYGSVDVWEKTPSSEKVGISRNDFNNSVISDNDISDIFGVPCSDIKRNTYNGKEYFEGFFNQSQELNGININVSMIFMVRIDNGWMYMFQFGGDENSSYYNDFISLMNSIKYPTVDYSTQKIPSYTTSSSESVYLDDEGSIRFDFLGLFLSLLLTISIYSLPVVIYRFAIRKRSMQRKQATIFVIVYAFIALILMSAIMALFDQRIKGTAIFLWSALNFYMLTKKSASEKTISKSSNSTVAQCTSCGYKDDYFKVCPICGNEGKTYLRSNGNRLEEIKLDTENVFDNLEDAKSFENNSLTNIKFSKNIYNSFENEKISLDISDDNITSEEALPYETKKAKIMFCRKCGAQVIDNSAFCNKCGVRIE